jgi:hypothetical protein
MSKVKGQIWMWIFKILVLAMVFKNLMSMLKLMKMFTKTLDLFPSSLPSDICKNV